MKTGVGVYAYLNRLHWAAVLVTAVAVALGSPGGVAFAQYQGHEYLCQDGLDNDGDTLVDVDDPDCQCYDDVFGPGDQCTAGDAKLVLIGLGDLTDGCVTSSDTMSIDMRVQVNVTANVKYNISWFLALDGGNARTGHCSRWFLNPTAPYVAKAVAGVDYFPHSGVGPFLNDSKNGPSPAGCGDAAAADNYTLVDLPFPLTDIPCASISGTGFVDMSRCSMWDVSANDNDTCVGFWETDGGQGGSKCNCQEAATNVPSPELAVSCSTSLSEARQGWPVKYTISYANSCTCTDATPGRQHRDCCTASYIRYVIDYDQSSGTISLLDDGAGTATDNGDTVTWVPMTDYLVAGGDSDTLTFNFTPSISTGSVNATVTTQWSDDLTTWVDQSVVGIDTCGFSVNPTWATVANVAAREDRGRVAVEWETAGEVGTLGFNLYRLDESTGGYSRVNPHLLPAVGGGPGASYRFVDEASATAARVTYMVEEVDVQGGRRELGPFTVDVAWAGESSGLREIQPGFHGQVREPSARLAGADRAAAAGAQTAASARTASRRLPPAARHAAKIRVGESGLVTVSAAEIAAALGGSDISAVRSGQIRLTNRGEEVAWHPTDALDGIVFFAEAPSGPYSRENVYWLERARGTQIEIAGTTGQMPVPEGASSFIDTVRSELNLLARPAVATAAEQDYWFWDYVISGNPDHERKVLSLRVPDPAEASQAASLVLGLWGLSDTPESPDHRVEVLVNGTSVGEVSWDGVGPVERTVEVAQELLSRGANEVALEGRAGTFFVDGFDLTYRRLYRAVDDALVVRGDGARAVTVSGFSAAGILVYDISEPRTPVRVAAAEAPAGDGGFAVTFEPASDEAEYLVAGPGAVRRLPIAGDAPSGLRATHNRADYLVLASADLAEAAQRLAHHRGRQGRTTLVVDVEDVYDEFNHGLSSPEAIRAFLRYALESWQLAPRFVVLAGRGHYDYLGYTAAPASDLPPLMVPTTYGLFPSDNAFVDLGGSGLPAVAIGRIPAADAAELEAYVDKILAYESAVDDGWTARALMIADNPDKGGDFAADSDALAALLPEAVSVDTVHLKQPFALDEARALVLAGLDAGGLLVGYVGHGGIDRLASEGLLTTADVAGLDNGGRLPFVMALTCYINSFAYPFYSPLGEELVMHSAGGAAAVWSASGLTANEESARLGLLAERAIFENGDKVLGNAVLRALADYGRSGGDPELIAVYVLLGDPGLVLR